MCFFLESIVGATGDVLLLRNAGMLLRGILRAIIIYYYLWCTIEQVCWVITLAVGWSRGATSIHPK